MKSNKISLPLIAPVESPWNHVILRLTSQKQFLNSENNHIETPKLLYRAYVFAELVRLRWEKKTFTDLRTRTEQFKLEATLWNRILDLIQELFLVDPSGYEHPAIWFIEVLLEEKLCGLFICAPDKNTALKNLQAENGQLWEKTNPFDEVETPHTWKFIDRAITLAERSDQISKKYYSPLVRARQALTTHLKSPAGRVFRVTPEGFIQKRQGRKKQVETT